MHEMKRKQSPRSKNSGNTVVIPFDVSDHLRTPADRIEYLNAWLETAPEDTAGVARALGDIARAAGMTTVARETGLSRESLYRALSAEGNPSFSTVLRVASALGMRLRVTRT